MTLEQELLAEFEKKHKDHVPYSCMEEMKIDLESAFAKIRASVYEEEKNRPILITKETNLFEEGKKAERARVLEWIKEHAKGTDYNDKYGEVGGYVERDALLSFLSEK